MSRGIQRERQVRDKLRNDDWIAFRAPASLGVADVIALRAGSTPRLVEVKSTAAGPYHSFGPKERAALSLAARMAGADAYLAWWPSRGKLHWITEAEWPKAREGLAQSVEPEVVILEDAGSNPAPLLANERTVDA